ncbi:lysophospholipid acyltransferase family protein [Novosphingobium sp.]|uniref:lysophospholipid acyltransferase family protein n=1 Tax=Novosphingobium sp. TaxID=1874826 RepID=UPI003B516C80
MPSNPSNAAPTLGEIVRNCLFYSVFYGGSLPLIAFNMTTLLLPRGALFTMVRVWCRWHRWCCRHILGITIAIEGAMPDHPVLVAMRHESFFEAIDLPALLHNPMIFAKQQLLTIPMWGRLGIRYGLIAVDREAGARALRSMIRTMRANAIGAARPLVIFPEGTRVPHNTQAPLQAGFAGLYKMANLPVVPIAVDSGPLYHRRWKRAGVIRYRIGAEIPVGLTRDAVEAAVVAAINVLND